MVVSASFRPQWLRRTLSMGPATAWPLLLAACGQLQAEERPTLVLDSTTVTATRSANSSFALPASVSTVDRENLDDAQADTLSRVLRSLPNVNVGGGPRPASQSPAIRGLQGPRIILSVDGARRNNEGGVNSPLLLDPDFIRQIDVVRGPMSAAYGSGGLGGVMAFETLAADDFVAPGQTFGGRAKVSYRSGDESASTNLTAAALNDQGDVLASATYRDYGTIHTAKGGTDAEYPNDGDLTASLFKAGLNLGDLNRLELGRQTFDDDFTGPTNPGGNLLFPFDQDSHRRQEQYTGNWLFHDADRALLDGRLSLYRTRYSLSGHSRSTPPQPDTSGMTRTDGGSLQNTTTFELGEDYRQRLTYGLDYYEDTAENTSAGQANSVLPDGRMRARGGFLQSEQELFQRWTLIAALRHDDYKLSSPGQDSTHHDRLSPKLALKYQPLDALGLFVSYGEAFRAPTMTEMYGNLNTNRALFNFRANPNLKPEASKTWEGGFTLDFGQLLAPEDRFRLKATWFDEEVEDLIDQQTVGTYTRQAPFAGTGLIFQRRNVAKAERRGGEVEAAYEYDRLTLGLGYSRLRSRNAQTGADLYAPPDKLALTLDYRLDEQWSVNYRSQFVRAQDYDDTLLRRRDGYALHDIGLTWEQDPYRVDLGVSNLFDQAYATYQQSQANTFTYEEGRSVNLTLSSRF